jgi:antitoxin component YwqK of YwqJK toxin-antitoxin module
MRRIDLNLDATSVDNELRLQYEGELFTGEVVEELIPGQLLSQELYVDGLPHGSIREWWPDGRLKSEGENYRGRPRGVFRHWHPDGRPAASILFDSEGTSRAVREWDGDGHRR